MNDEHRRAEAEASRIITRALAKRKSGGQAQAQDVAARVREAKLTISMQRALDNVPGEQMQPHGMWAFDPDAEWAREQARPMQRDFQEWIAESWIRHQRPDYPKDQP
ncbi:hypothetical protein AB0C10_37520 [Microbispora amethystogenes]|uniref:hypothetical protein n=1 Tax=Microbispora amethystogenes TaxID=1427754 RepID=UPI0033E146EC